MDSSSFRRERFERLTDDEDTLTKLEDDFNEQSEEEQVERNDFIDAHSDEDIRREYKLPGGETTAGRRSRRARAGGQSSDGGSGEPGGSGAA